MAHGGALKPGHQLMKVGRLFYGDMLTWVIPRHLPLSALFGTVRDMTVCSVAEAVDDAGLVTKCLEALPTLCIYIYHKIRHQLRGLIQISFKY